jgi:hypothetical protein
MFYNISWQGYWTFLAVSVVLYYLFVAIFFYASDLKRWVKAKALVMPFGSPAQTDVVVVDAKPSKNPPEASVETAQPAPVFKDDEEGLPLPVQALVDEIQAFMAVAADRHLTKNAILQSLSSLVQKYPGLAHSPYRPGIEQIIQFTTEHICSIHLSAEEVEHVWEG